MRKRYLNMLCQRSTCHFSIIDTVPLITVTVVLINTVRNSLLQANGLNLEVQLQVHAPVAQFSPSLVKFMAPK